MPRGLCSSIPSSSRSQNPDAQILWSRSRCLNCLSSVSPENSFHAEQNGSFCCELGPKVPRFHWWSITHSYSGPFVSAANFPETYVYDVHRFSHLCCFLVHNNDLPAFISFNDPLNGEMFPCHVTCLMLAWFQELKVLHVDDLKRVTLHQSASWWQVPIRKGERQREAG